MKAGTCPRCRGEQTNEFAATAGEAAPSMTIRIEQRLDVYSVEPL